MNPGNNYSRICTNGDKEDKERLFKLVNQRANNNAASLTKTSIRKSLIREFMDCCIYNEYNRSKREKYKDFSLESFFDDRYRGLKLAIYFLGFSWETISEIEQLCKELAGKYYPNDFKTTKDPTHTAPWKIELVPVRTDSLKQSQKFRWFNSGYVPVFTFDRIEDNKIFTFTESGSSLTWDHFNFCIVYIEKND